MLLLLRRMQSTASCVMRCGPVLRITVQARPGAKKNSIDEVTAEYVGIHIAARPQEGAANQELCEFVAEVLGLRRREVAISPASAKSRSKVLEVSSSTLSAEAVLTALQRASTRP